MSFLDFTGNLSRLYSDLVELVPSVEIACIFCHDDAHSRLRDDGLFYPEIVRAISDLEAGWTVPLCIPTWMVAVCKPAISRATSLSGNGEVRRRSQMAPRFPVGFCQGEIESLDQSML